MIHFMSYRFLSISRHLYATVEKSALAALRKKTGYSFSNCKKALEMFGSDIEKAENWLRAEAQKEGWAKVAKVKDRTASKGVISVSWADHVASIIELKCETDFVAKTKEFQILASRIASLCNTHALEIASSKSGDNLEKVQIQPEELLARKLPDGKTLADAIALDVGKLGENAQLSRAMAFCTAPSGPLRVCAISHPTLIPLQELPGTFIGQYGALLAFKQKDEGPTVPFAQQLCKHIVAMNPSSIGTLQEFEEYRNAPPPPPPPPAAEIPKPEGEAEEEEFKDDEHFADEKSKIFSEDEHRLLCQEFLLNPDVFVGDLVIQYGIEIVDFARFALGQKLAEETVDSRAQQHG